MLTRSVVPELLPGSSGGSRAVNVTPSWPWSTHRQHQPAISVGAERSRDNGINLPHPGDSNGCGGPRARPERCRAPSVPREHGPLGDIMPAKPTIIVVMDEATTRQTLEDNLSRRYGADYAVRCVEA